MYVYVYVCIYIHIPITPVYLFYVSPRLWLIHVSVHDFGSGILPNITLGIIMDLIQEPGKKQPNNQIQVQKWGISHPPPQWTPMNPDLALLVADAQIEWWGDSILLSPRQMRFEMIAVDMSNSSQWYDDGVNIPLIFH